MAASPSHPEPQTPDRLRPGEVHLWLADGEGEPAPPDDGGGVLSEDERARAARFRFPVHARRFRFAHVVLRRVLSRYAGSPPGELSFETGTYGKPRLAPVSGEAPPFRFNLAHSGDLVLVGVCRDGETGVDLEAVDPAVDVRGIGRRFFHPAEVRVLEGLSGEACVDAFFRIWTRKEAFVKAVGAGLFLCLPSVDVTAGRVRLPEGAPRGASGGDFRLVDLPSVEGFRAAAAVPPEVRTVRCLAWNNTGRVRPWPMPNS
ncbi:MAG: 4'-phosphopantetheinyl transferase superfamily protein [Acidobacteria bacterium]|nr:4'-phosphopantetheinyl transferase superfamily protein [Acidobacteriota bacterium]